MLRRALLRVYSLIYTVLLRPLIFRHSAMDAHATAMRTLATADQSPPLLALLRVAHKITHREQPLTAGGVQLQSPLFLAAGFVKGMGFDSEEDALAAVERGEDIIPGWRAMPALVGAVEFGSFTRHPRIGNSGVVLWRDEPTHSTQNRVGLKNPGARAAAAFLHRHRSELPALFGINVAVSPGVTDPAQERQEVLEALTAFTECGVFPTWFTLNLSCPNTADDPNGNQTEDKVRDLCGAAVNHLQAFNVPLWVKISPQLSKTQHQILIATLEDMGVRAVIATNTVPQPAPDDPSIMAGVGGGQLHPFALEACSLLMREKQQHNYEIDVIGCGGVLDGATYRDFTLLGVRAVQYWSALVYHGPLAAAVILDEAS